MPNYFILEEGYGLDLLEGASSCFITSRQFQNEQSPREREHQDRNACELKPKGSGRIYGAVVSSLGIFGNPLEKDEKDKETAKSWAKLIDNAHLFGTDIVAGFTGRLSKYRCQYNLFIVY